MTDGVIIEYKNRNVIRIVESATERRDREYHTTKRADKARISRLQIVGSVHKESIRKEWYQCGFYSDLKCWKNQRHARKNWMRHINRISPSTRILADNCIYPDVATF